MAKIMSDEHQVILTEMIEEYGVVALMATLFGNGEVSKAAKASVGAKMTPRERRATGKRDKTRYVTRANEEHPEWNVGDGKGYRVNALLKALETGEEPHKTPLSGYMIFLADQRPTLKEDGFTGKETAREAGRRWGELTVEDKLGYTNRGREDIGMEAKELDVDNNSPSSNTRSKVVKPKEAKTQKTTKATKAKTQKATKASKHSSPTSSVASSKKGRAGGRKKVTTKKTTKKTTPKRPTPSTAPSSLGGMFDTDADSSDEE
jgi:hypothetical protein